MVKQKVYFFFFKNKVQTIDANSTEANIESLLKSIIEELAYSVEQQKGGQIDGEQSRIDILLFECDEYKANFNKKSKESKNNNKPIPAEDILLIVEVKGPSFNFNAKYKVKETEDQLYRYSKLISKTLWSTFKWKSMETL